MSAVPTLVHDSLAVLPWPDPIIDTLGYKPHSAYVETYWLGILGPSTTWLLRRLVAGLDTSPDGFELPLSETARCLGLGDKGGRHSPFIRSIGRLVQFDLATSHGEGELAVRRRVPPLNRRQLLRLPPSLQESHRALVETELRRPPFEQQRQRSRQLALSLLELGEDLQAAEHQLLRWGFQPGLASESAEWAWERHHALADGEGGDGP
ncbi:MAG TPA: hypothetical protein VFA94_08405 [Acidimicrobiales bacterium]|nr:hypothetical protein [Acidimicrobiales bacterium]